MGAAIETTPARKLREIRMALTLDKTFTVWGRVVAGMDVVKALNDGEPPPSPDRMTKVRIMADMPPAERPQLEVMDVRGPAFASAFKAAFEAHGSGLTLCDLDLSTRNLGG